MAVEIEQLPDRTEFRKFASQPGWMRVAFPINEMSKGAELFVTGPLRAKAAMH